MAAGFQLITLDKARKDSTSFASGLVPKASNKNVKL